MTTNRQTTGRLSADDSIRCIHFRRDMFKSYGNLIAFLTEALCHAVQHMRGADIADYGTVPALVFHQVVVQQYQNVIGMQEVSLFIDDTDTVRITVGCDSHVAFSVQNIVL